MPASDSLGPGLTPHPHTKSSVKEVILTQVHHHLSLFYLFYQIESLQWEHHYGQGEKKNPFLRVMSLCTIIQLEFWWALEFAGCHDVQLYYCNSVDHIHWWTMARLINIMWPAHVRWGHGTYMGFLYGHGIANSCMSVHVGNLPGCWITVDWIVWEHRGGFFRAGRF